MVGALSLKVDGGLRCSSKRAGWTRPKVLASITQLTSFETSPAQAHQPS